MIGVLTASTTSGSVLGYDLGDLKDKEQRIQILGSEGVFMDARQVDRLNQNWTDAASLKEFKFVSRAVADDLAKQFDSQASVNDRVVRTTGHIALSFSPKDRPRLQDNEFKVQLATEYMEQMGIVDTQWVITEHYDTNAPHLHIAYNRVKFDGTVIDSKNERYRSEKVAAEISEKYGLAVAGTTPRLEQSLNPEQQQFEQMRLQARGALQQSCTMEEFRQHLQERGISLRESEHSEQKKSFGLSYSMTNNPDISAKGSKLDRSALSYDKVTATLARNLANRTALEAKQAAQQEQARAKELRVAYGKMIPTIQGLDKAVNDTFQLCSDTKQAGIAVNAQTTQKYGELKQLWSEFRQLNQERQKASTAGALIKGIGGMMMLLNPVAGLLAIVIGKIATDIRLSNIQSEKKALLSRIDGLKSDIDSLQQQKAQIKIEKPERLNDYLQAKDARNEFRAGMDKMKEEIQQLKEQTKPKFTFDFKAARQQAATAAPVAQNPVISTATPARSTLDISSILLSAKDKDSMDLALLSKKVVIEPIKDRLGGVSDFKVTLAAEGRVINASNLVSGDRMRQMVDKWESLTGEQPAYKLEIQRERKLADICAKMDAASPENAPRIPKSISFLPGGEIQITFTTRKGNTPTLKVDASGKLCFNGLILDIKTGKYIQQPTQHQTPHHSQGESRGKNKGYGGHKR